MALVASIPTLTDRQARRLRVLEKPRPPGTVLLHEIYVSIQGESTRAGLPCTFIRLTGCHLRCRWCDSPHAFNQGEPATLEEILERVKSLPPTLVELTGGEPLAQAEAWPLLTALADLGKTVLVETSGAWPIDGIDPRVTIIMDLKCPGSGEVGANRWSNIELLRPHDEIKFVIADRGDFEWMLQVVDDHQLRRWPLLVSPVFGECDYESLCQWIIESGLPLRFQPQVHKHVWHPKQRGV